jgi:glycosyltransferase involved in cell wall biosynthesis
MAQFLDAVARRHRVALLYLRSLDEPPLGEAFHERCELVEEVIRPLTGELPLQQWLRKVSLITSLLRFRPLWVTDWACRAYGERVRSLVHQWSPDLVQIEYHVMGQYIPYLDGTTAPRVLTEYEPGIRAAPYLQTVSPVINPLIHQLDRLAWRRFETRVIRSVQAVVVFTSDDKKSLETLGLKTRLVHIPFGTNLPDQPLNPSGCPPLSLLFLGSFIHPPNVEAALRLASVIYPSVRNRYPELELYIAGDQPPPELKKFSSEAVHITGLVPEITPYLNQAAVFVAPLFSGGGMRVKVLEALAAGKAIVATPLAIEGLNLHDGEQISIAQDDREITAKIIQLISNPDLRTAQAKRARAWALANLGWGQAVESYEALWQDLLANEQPV